MVWPNMRVHISRGLKCKGWGKDELGSGKEKIYFEPQKKDEFWLVKSLMIKTTTIKEPWKRI